MALSLRHVGGAVLVLALLTLLRSLYGDSLRARELSWDGSQHDWTTRSGVDTQVNAILGEHHPNAAPPSDDHTERLAAVIYLPHEDVVTEGEIHDEGVEEGKGEGFDVMHADDGVSSSAEHDHAGRTRVHSVFSSHGVHSEPEAAAARNNNTLGCTSGDAASPDHMKRTWDALENKSLRFRLNRPHAKEPTATMLSSHMFLRYNATTKKEQLHESVRVHVPGGPVFTLHVGAPLVALLPKQPPEWHFDSCAVVGNSGVLLNTTFGSDIDAHQVVIRLNAAPTYGYIEHVGAKTSARVMNNAIVKVLTQKIAMEWDDTRRLQVLGDESVALWLRASNQSEYELVQALRSKGDQRLVMGLSNEFTYAVLPLFRDYYFSYLQMAARDTKTATKAVAARMHRLRMKTAKDLELGDHGDHIFGKPTTGMAVLYALKDICHAVTLYGFGTHDDSGNPTTYKYYRQTTTDVQTASVGLVGNTVSGTVGSHAHSFLFEQEMLHALDHDHVLRLCSYMPGNKQHNAHCTNDFAPLEFEGDKKKSWFGRR